MVCVYACVCACVCARVCACACVHACVCIHVPHTFGVELEVQQRLINENNRHLKGRNLNRIRNTNHKFEPKIPGKNNFKKSNIHRKNTQYMYVYIRMYMIKQNDCHVEARPPKSKSEKQVVS